MREIKFRGRERESNKWVFGYVRHWKCCYGDKWHIQGENDNVHIVISETIGQFTGLYDTDGREIYEGDILDIDGDFIAEVVYCDGAYELYTKQGPLGKLGDIAYEYSLAIVDGVIETFSVIGNVHDSPELLGAGHERN